MILSAGSTSNTTSNTTSNSSNTSQHSASQRHSPVANYQLAPANSQQPQQSYQHKLTQVNLRTSDRLPAEQVSASELEPPAAKGRRSRADSSRLSVILPSSAMLEQRQQQQPASSLETPVALQVLSESGGQLQRQQLSSSLALQGHDAYQPNSGCGLFNSLIQLTGPDGAGSFTGLPSCTPTSADALAASGNLRPINPFFFNVGSYTPLSDAKTTCDSYGQQQQQQQAKFDDPQSIPEDLSPRTKARMLEANSSVAAASAATKANDKTSQLRLEQMPMPAGALVLSPFTFPLMLTSEHEAWLRLSLQPQPQPQPQHPSAAQKVPQQMPIYDEASFAISQQPQPQPQQQQHNPLISQHQKSVGGELGSERSISSASLSSSSNLAQDLSNQQQLIGRQQQQHRASAAAAAIATRLTQTSTISPSDPASISAASTQLAPGRETIAQSATPTCIPKTSVQTNVLMSAQQQYQTKLGAISLNKRLDCPPPTCAMFAQQPGQCQPAAGNEPAQGQIFIPVHQRQQQQQQPQPQLQPQTKDCLYSCAIEVPPYEQVNQGYVHTNLSYQSATSQQLMAEQRSESTARDSAISTFNANLAKSPGANPSDTIARLDNSKPRLSGIGSGSNSSSAFNCSSPMTLSSVSGSGSGSASASASGSGSGSGSSSARSSISRDTSTSIEVAMASSQQARSLNLDARTSKTINGTDSNIKVIHDDDGKTASKINKSANGSHETGTLIGCSQEPVKKKSKGGRKKKQVTHEEMIARKNRSKERNRVAAKRCRQKRKQFIDDLCAKINNLTDLSRKLQKENAQLKEELDRIKNKQLECS